MRIGLIIFSLVIVSIVKGQNFVKYDLSKMGSSMPMKNGAIVFDNKLYFDATDSIHGRELWVQDALNTYPNMLLDINKAPLKGSDPKEFVIFNNKLYFTITDSFYKTQLWFTDGTDTGTHQFQALQMMGGSVPLRLEVLLGKLFFVAKDDSTQCYNIWCTDGTLSGTSRISAFKNIPIHSKVTPYAFSEFKGKVFFIQTDSFSGTEMYVTDGTMGGTKLFKDFCPFLYCSGLLYDYFIVFKDRLFFVATDSLSIRRLWVSDGTVPGTSPYFKRDLNILTGNGMDSLHVFGDYLYFVFKDSARVQFGFINGTDTILRTLKYDVGHGSGPIDFQAVNEVNFGKRMIMAGRYISGSSGTHYYIFTYDTVSKNLWLAQPVKCEYYLFPTKKFVYIIGDEGIGNGYELWETSGRELETLKRKPSYAPNTDPLIKTIKIIEFNDEIYYCANYDSSGYELWKLTYKPVFPIGIGNKSNSKKLLIAPNPSRNEICITNPSERKIELKIIDNKGTLLFSGMIQGNEVRRIDTSEYSKGIYYLVSEEFDTSKFILEY